MPQTYVITGATSFIGKRLTAQLLADGQQVCAVCRDEATARQKLGDSKGLTVVEAQLEDYGRLSERIPHADVFIHLAWEGTGHDGRNMTEVQQSNIRHSHEAMQQAVSMGCRLFVEAGSQAEYGTQLQTITEETPCLPFSEYGKAKLGVCRQGFAMAEQQSIKYLHLRIFSLFGEDDHPWTLVMSCVDRMLRNESIALSACTQNWNFLYVADAAKQITRLCQYALTNDAYRHEIYNIASEDTRPLREFVEEMHTLTHSQSELHYGAVQPIHTVSLQPDMSKTKHVAGFIGSHGFEDIVKRIMGRY